MATLAVRIAHGPIGRYHCEPPWTTVHSCDTVAAMLGLDGVKTLTVDEITAAQTGHGDIRYDEAVAHTLRTGEPLVMTHTQHRRSDAVDRILVTVTDVQHDGHGCPIALCGLAADITDTICAGQDLASQHLVGIVDCGPALVVLLCGEFDMRWRTELEQAMDTVLHHHGTGPVYLDARHLRFCDARSMSIITGAAAELTARRRPTVLLNPSPILRRVLSLLTSPGRPLPFRVRVTPGLPDPARRQADDRAATSRAER